MKLPPAQEPLRLRDVRRRFDRAAGDFERHAFVHRHAMAGLLERLDPVQVPAGRVLDLGAATGLSSRRLAQVLGRRPLVSLDLSRPMLARARAARSRFSRIREVQGDALRLPFADGSFGLAVANLLLPWIGRPELLFREVARVLAPGGVFAFSTLGPDSLLPLRAAWAEVDADPHVHPFPDMHDIGDALVRARLRDPVLDVDRLTVSYRTTTALFGDLSASGARNALRQRRAGLTGKGRFGRLRQALEARFVDGSLEVGLELVYGHAWGGGPATPPGEYRVDPAAIGRLERQS